MNENTKTTLIDKNFMHTQQFLDNTNQCHATESSCILDETSNETV